MNHRHARRTLVVAVPAALLLIAGCQGSDDVASQPSMDQPLAQAGRPADRAAPPAPPPALPSAAPTGGSPGAGSSDGPGDYGRSAAPAPGTSEGKAGAGTTGASGQAGDAAITAAVKARLLADPTLNAQTIEVTTKDGGQVTLTGHVKSEAARERAEQLARGARGVRNVDNQLVVGSA